MSVGRCIGQVCSWKWKHYLRVVFPDPTLSHARFIGTKQVDRECTLSLLCNSVVRTAQSVHINNMLIPPNVWGYQHVIDMHRLSCSKPVFTRRLSVFTIEPLAWP